MEDYAQLFMAGFVTYGDVSGATAQPRNRATAQPRNRATAQPRNRATAQPRNRAIVQGFFCLPFALFHRSPSLRNYFAILSDQPSDNGAIQSVSRW